MILTSKEKAELLKPTIEILFSKEGRSRSYISSLLDINRKTISDKIKEWDLPEAEPRKHLTASNQKFLNKNKQMIKSRLDNDIEISAISKELGVTKDYLYNIIRSDSVLKKASDDKNNRMHESIDLRKQRLMDKSSYEYDIIDLDHEEWRDILGYEGYMVSNKGRVKHFSKRYNVYHLLTPAPNKNNGRLYVSITHDYKRKNFNLARLVAHAFVEGYSEEKNTVNHKDGNVTNNNANNLEWVSQAENNLHAFKELHRNPSDKRRYKFSKILYKDKYEFKTVKAFAKFLGKSETQTRRYLDNAEEYDIKLIP